MSTDTERRRAGLLAAKLRAVVRATWDDGDRRPATFPGGAALREGDRGWVLADESADRALGPALLWALRGGVRELHVLADADSGETGHLARRAAAFREPPSVWAVEGTEARPAAPAPVPVEPRLDPGVAAFAELLRRAGAEPLVEHGVLVGEVLGLEVARVSTDAHGPHLEVGVGKHDREAQRLVHGDQPAEEALARAVQTVAEHRRPGARPHPLNRLARERWLRAALVERPALVGAAHLAPVPSPVVRHDLRRPAPAPAAGEDTAGRPLLVVCSVGIDLDLVPAAADAALADGRRPRLVLAVPRRDDHPITRQLADLLVEPAEIAVVDLPVA